MLRFTFALLLVVAAALGCSCLPPKPFKEAVTSVKDSKSPYFVAKVLSTKAPLDINGDRTYKLKVTTGCGKVRTQIAITCGNGACCGVQLNVGATYALPLLKSGGESRIGLCQVIRDVSTLSKEQIKLVTTCTPNDTLRCRPRCKCLRCPCAFRPRCPPGYVCKGTSCVRVKPCSMVRCNPADICIGGKCVARRCAAPGKPLCRARFCRRCEKGWKCVNRRCVKEKECTAGSCSPAELCIGGRCVARRCAAPGQAQCRALFCRQCEKGWKCVDRRCEKKCTDDSCGPTGVCTGTKCIPRRCNCRALFCRQCNKGWKCVNQQCVKKRRCTDESCGPTKVCLGDRCFPRDCSPCKAAFCRPCDPGWYCLKRRCVRLVRPW